jgi:hypothetical protein
MLDISQGQFPVAVSRHEAIRVLSFMQKLLDGFMENPAIKNDKAELVRYVEMSAFQQKLIDSVEGTSEEFVTIPDLWLSLTNDFQYRGL